MHITEYNNLSKLEEIKETWDRLAKQSINFVPSCADLRTELQAEGSKFRVLAAVDESQIKALACFIYKDEKRRYHIGARRLFHLPVQTVTLFGSSVLGEPSEQIIRIMFQHIIAGSGFDLIDVGYIFVDSPLYNAIRSLDGAFAWRAARKKQIWWLIKMPSSFDRYFASLNERTRYHVARDYRRFERQAPVVLILTLPEEVDAFLKDAEKISRLTYQWKLTYGLCDDESTRQHFIRLAQKGNLRCYVSYIRGEPCAFGWGDLIHGKFYFRQTGYNPKFRNLSPGTSLMLRIIRDLIENTDCQVFHFQWGGEQGYKSRLATVGLACGKMQVAPIYRSYSLLILALDQMVNLAKNVVGLVVERGPLKKHFRSILRRAGVGTF